MDNFRIALIQCNVELGQPEHNFGRAALWVAQAKEHGARLALLPELWTTGYDLEHAAQHGTRLDEGSCTRLAEIAQEHQIYVCGSMLEAAEGRYFNTQVLYSPRGERLSHYRKMHLFGLMNEPDYLAAGDTPVVADLPAGKAGLAICYDLRFPELFRRYALEGAQLILLSAEWPQPCLEHWRALLRAQAIENQYFIAACNRVGQTNNTVFWGHSLLIDPWGEILAEGGENEAILVADLDLTRMTDTRQRMPVFADQRVGLYALP